ncbi:MAG: M23 family metallopeptidase [Cytophagales bacterium]|nr:M23 family metallopeptidase [Bernardetiaceae bacterium]MDW8206017.1 M23 family metallopeptidase [Cytophagales bacterium]
MKKSFFTILLFALLWLTNDLLAQKKATRKENTGDFVEFTIPGQRWKLSDEASINGKRTKGTQSGKNGNSLLDTLVAQENGKEKINRMATGGSSGIQDGHTAQTEQMRKALRNYLQSRGFDNDTLIIKDLFNENRPPLDFLDLGMRRSMLREDTTDLYDVPEEDIVIVSEEVNIDSTWITISDYYSIWDTENINPYKFDIRQFRDTIPLILYDSLKQQRWSPPLTNIKLTSEFGMRGWRWHHGVDLDLNTGDPVFASFDGVVRIRRYERGGYGNFIVLRHSNGLETLYAHLSKQLLQVGDTVSAGQIIGLGGSTGRSTGPHLHYEVRYNGYAFDPKYIYDFEEGKIISHIFRLSPEHFQHLLNQRQTISHIVKRGDTLSRIARKYRTSVRQLIKLNGISATATLKPGRRIRVR